MLVRCVDEDETSDVHELTAHHHKGRNRIATHLPEIRVRDWVRHAFLYKSSPEIRVRVMDRVKCALVWILAM